MIRIALAIPVAAIFGLIFVIARPFQGELQCAR
jgi:hypothetical protein